MTQGAENKENRSFDMSDVLFGTRASTAILLLFGAMSVLIGWDLITDYESGTDWLHLAIESLILLAAAAGLVWLCLRFLRLRDAAQLLTRDLMAARAEAQRWREDSRDLLRGLGVAIERQFVRWKLTPAESEVGLLLLKGLSHKEAARIRGTSERTVRQQARSLYVKAGLAGRSELSAFFLEDLLLPHDGQA